MHCEAPTRVPSPNLKAGYWRESVGTFGVVGYEDQEDNQREEGGTRKGVKDERGTFQFGFTVVFIWKQQLERFH